MNTTRKRKPAPAAAHAADADGFYRVELSAPFERRGFTYRPGARLRVSAALLQDMQEAGVVADVSPV